MYTRSLRPPTQAFFLFGPRGTGKSTWLSQVFGNAHTIDLLPFHNAAPYEKNPSLLLNEVLALPKEKWTLIDEVQKVPALLEEVHSLMETHGHKLFALTGSSARKLKRSGVNMLAGRAMLRHLFPLTSEETGFALPFAQILSYGCLPMSVTAGSDADREDFLRSYVTTYLKEEIKAEGLVRQVGSFARFLDTLAVMAGQKINFQGLARDIGIHRETVKTYFEILEDTLIGSWLPAFRPRAKIKEVAQPKFYLFDSGVLNAIAGGFDQPLPRDWKGVLLEHWIFHELKAYLHYNHIRGHLAYWETPSHSEIDFFWWYGSRQVAIEVKSSVSFDSDFLKGIRSFEESQPLTSSWVVYLGQKEFKIGNTWVLPVDAFLKKLHQGNILVMND
jgi:predicted AAA+ superfamily ATPase